MSREVRVKLYCLRAVGSALFILSQLDIGPASVIIGEGKARVKLYRLSESSIALVKALIALWYSSWLL